MTGRPPICFIHGNNCTYREAVKEAGKIRAVLEANGGLSPEALFIVFDWPIERRAIRPGGLPVMRNRGDRESRVTISRGSCKRHLRARESASWAKPTAAGSP